MAKKSKLVAAPEGKPKILYFDIENAPNLSYTWGAGYEENVIEVVQPWFVLSFAYLWEGNADSTTECVMVTPTEARECDDRRVIAKMYELFEEADIIIGHNSDRFDRKKINARAVIHGFLPPQPYRTVDTLKIARQNFAFNSNRLDMLGEVLGVGRKVPHTGFKLWKECMAGIPAALKMMAEYNIGDVTLTRRVYMKLRPYHATHPNLSIYGDVENRHTCPKCGADESQLTSRGYKYTNVAVKRTWQCKVCGGWSSSRVSEKPDLRDRTSRNSA